MITARITGRRRPALSKWELIFRKVRERNRRGKRFSIVCVAEGVRLPDVGEIVKSYDAKRTDARHLGGVGAYVAQRIAAATQVDMRVTMLGHLQRGGSPTALDRNLATRFGVAALRLVKEKKFGNMVALRGPEIIAVPLKKAVARLKLVPPDHPLVMAARSVGTSFGDKL